MGFLPKNSQKQGETFEKMKKVLSLKIILHKNNLIYIKIKLNNMSLYTLGTRKTKTITMVTKFSRKQHGIITMLP